MLWAMTVQIAPDRASELLTVGEAMAELRCSESTVRRLIRSGELPAVTIGSARAIRIPRAGLGSLLEPVSQEYSAA
jgi:excisionase family DNA binding protein